DRGHEVAHPRGVRVRALIGPPARERVPVHRADRIPAGEHARDAGQAAHAAGDWVDLRLAAGAERADGAAAIARDRPVLEAGAARGAAHRDLDDLAARAAAEARARRRHLDRGLRVL